MATILKARGRMTKDLATPYQVGDQAVALVTEHQRYGCVHVGEVGTIRRVVISDPNDSDATFLMTFLMFYVRFGHGTILLHPSEFAPAAEAEAHLWARRQVEGLATCG